MRQAVVAMSTVSNIPSSSTTAATVLHSLPHKPMCYLHKTENSAPATTINPGANGRTENTTMLFPDLTHLSAEVEGAEKRREEAYMSSRKIHMAISACRMAMDHVDNVDGEAEMASALDALVEKVTTNNNGVGYKENNRAPREANLGVRMEDYARLRAYRHFLSTGTLIRLSDFHWSHTGGGGNGASLDDSNSNNSSVVSSFLRDEEYIGGACIGLSHDLARYAVGRATAGDIQSVKIAKQLTESLMSQLLKFDFRNGPLRKKYDGVKYALKKVETILYELSVSHDRGEIRKKHNSDMELDVQQTYKRAKVEEGEKSADCDSGDPIKVDSPPKTEENDLETVTDEGGATTVTVERLCEAEIEEVRLRMEHRDDMRERIIKRCRDGQKAAKQAIFAMHREDFKRSKRLLGECEKLARELMPLIQEEPTLRYGSFANVMEEYAEAKLFALWLEDGRGRVAGPAEFPLVLEPDEYIGGLCDLTGEVGRFAVQRGTARDVDGVRMCLETNLSILNILQSIYFPSKVFKKLDPLRRSVEKLEHVLYELSLIDAGRHAPAYSVQESYDEDGDESKNQG